MSQYLEKSRSGAQRSGERALRTRLGRSRQAAASSASSRDVTKRTTAVHASLRSRIRRCRCLFNVLLLGIGADRLPRESTRTRISSPFLYAWSRKLPCLMVVAGLTDAALGVFICCVSLQLHARFTQSS